MGEFFLLLKERKGKERKKESNYTDVLFFKSVPLLPPIIDTPSGHWVPLGFYALPPNDGHLLDGPISTSPRMTTELCGSVDCQGYNFLALADGECVFYFTLLYFTLL